MEWITLRSFINCLLLLVFFNYYFFYYLVCVAIGTAATPGLLCQSRVIMTMIVEKQMECRVAGETEVLGENLPQRHFCLSQNPTWPDQSYVAAYFSTSSWVVSLPRIFHKSSSFCWNPEVHHRVPFILSHFNLFHIFTRAFFKIFRNC
jgi:hypothetical protein